MPYERRTEIYTSDQQLYPSTDNSHNALMTGHHLSHLVKGRFNDFLLVGTCCPINHFILLTELINNVSRCY